MQKCVSCNLFNKRTCISVLILYYFELQCKIPVVINQVGACLDKIYYSVFFLLDVATKSYPEKINSNRRISGRTVAYKSEQL